MKLFECDACGQPLYFENQYCESCGRRLGFIADTLEFVALDRADADWAVAAAVERRVRFCANAAHDVCNWLMEARAPDTFCRACRHNRTIPALSSRENLRRWRLIEDAKRRLFYTLIELRLPLKTRAEDPKEGLVFDFLDDDAPSAPRVVTGHRHGLITLNIAEADDAERERRREAMGEVYRTLLGHFRHEIGHYYWDRLVRDDPLALGRCRDIFGDERRDYEGATRAHYAKGPPPDWRAHFVSAYASAHPWEDFAESFAHYLHIVDTLETATSFGLSVRPRIARGDELSATLDLDFERVSTIEPLMKAWLPLTFTVNSLNRGMGQPDLYPFVLSPQVVGKLGFIHHLVHRTLSSEASGTHSLAPNIAQPASSPA
jgi:hypothetical protein